MTTPSIGAFTVKLALAFSVAMPAGATELIGRNTWPDWSTDILTSSFILDFRSLVQTGMIGSRTSSKELGLEDHADSFSRRAIKIAPWLLQITLLLLLLMILLY